MLHLLDGEGDYKMVIMLLMVCSECDAGSR